MVKTYGPGSVIIMIRITMKICLSDLPAGLYKVHFDYEGKQQQIGCASIRTGNVFYLSRSGLI